MRLVSFDAFRSLHMPDVHYIKPDSFHQHIDLLREADWVLFPEYWQLNALHYGLNCRIFPSLASYHLGHNKIETTRVLQLLWPHNMPDTLIGPNEPRMAEYFVEKMGYPLVAKIPKSSEGRGVFLIENQYHWQQYCATQETLYVQQLLPIDRDLRLVVIGQQVIGGYWRTQGQNGFHNNIAQGGEVFLGLLPESAVSLVTDIAKTLGIDHAGFDIAMVDGHPYVLEFNRLFGNLGLTMQNIEPGKWIYDYLLSQHEPEKTPPLFPPLQVA